MDAEKIKNALREKIGSDGFDVLYQEEIIKDVVEIMDSPMVWNPVKHWLRMEAKTSKESSAQFIDDWISAITAMDVKSDSDVFFNVGDHVEVAAHMAEIVEEKGRVVYDMNQFYQYRDKGIWEHVEPKHFSIVISRFSGAPVAGSSENRPPSKLKVSSGMIDGVIRVYRDHVNKSGNDNRDGFFDTAPAGIMFDDVFLRVDLSNNKIIQEEPNAEHRQTMSAGCKFDGDLSTPIFDSYLASIFEGDPDAEAKADLMIEFAAAAMAGIATEFQKALILYDATDRSTGSNGKSVYVKILHELFPANARSSISPTEFSEKFTRALLAGKRINFVTEMPDEHGVISGETTKAVISGEPIKAENKNETPFFFRPKAGHLFACNDFPSVSDHSDAFWRRWMVIPFNKTFSSAEADLSIVERIVENEREAILRKIGLALGDVVRRGHYRVPDECEAAFGIWKRESDSVLQFLVDESANYTDRGYIGELEDRSADWTKSTSLFESYREWCTFWGLRSYGKTKFGRRCAKLLEKKRKSDGMYYRVRLKQESNYSKAEQQEYPNTW